MSDSNRLPLKQLFFGMIQRTWHFSCRLFDFRVFFNRCSPSCGTLGRILSTIANRVRNRLRHCALNYQMRRVKVHANHFTQVRADNFDEFFKATDVVNELAGEFFNGDLLFKRIMTSNKMIVFNFFKERLFGYANFLTISAPVTKRTA